jgi:prepilin-type N-terminal cleavage/methylation domain-containing protein
MTTRRRPGFTLLELTVALAISAVAMAAGAAALSALVDRRTAARDATYGLAQITATRETVGRWIASAELDATGASRFQGAPDELTFRTTARTPFGDAPSRIRLFIARNGVGLPSGLAATVTDLRTGANRSIAIDSTVTSLALRYRANEAGGGGWQSSWNSTNALPAAVELRFSHRPVPPTSAIADAPWTVVVEGGR